MSDMNNVDIVSEQKVEMKDKQIINSYGLYIDH